MTMRRESASALEKRSERSVDMTELAKKICLLRSQARMTQLALAEKLEVSRQTVSKWELGTAQPELDKLVALSEL